MDRGEEMSERKLGWGREFDEPIPAGRRALITLRDAAAYIQKLPKGTQEREEWQTAVRSSLTAAKVRMSDNSPP